jgi:hypothetical protein
MLHGFSEQEWTDYLEGHADETLRDRFEAHLIGCVSCWEFNELMAMATSTLRREGQASRETLVLQDRQLQTGLGAVYARIHTAVTDAPPSAEMQEGLAHLADVLTPMCGSQTANRALQVAAITSPAQTLDQINAANWDSFLERLASITSVMCGETGADLIRLSGQIYRAN